MTQTKVSIMAPCYNGEEYIARFLQSVLDQTYDNIQLIIVNDGSKDSTEEILCDYEARFSDRGFEYIHLNQENKGIGGALNDALKLVTGEYMTWFGTDDYMMPDYVERLAAFLDANAEFAVVRCDGYLVDIKDHSVILGKMADGNHDKHQPHLFENAIMERNFNFGYSMLRMSVFDEVNPSREIYPSREGQNWQLLLPIFYAHKSAFCETPLYNVVHDLDSVSRVAHKSYERLKEQNAEYERILTNVLASMDIPDKAYYEDMVTVKYIRRRMLAAIDFAHYDDAMREYALLKERGIVTPTDRKRYIRARFAVIDKTAKKLKKLLKH